MLKIPEFLKYPEWYIEDPKYSNEIGYNKGRYKIKDNAPEFIKKNFEEYLENISNDGLYFDKDDY